LDFSLGFQRVRLTIASAFLVETQKKAKNEIPYRHISISAKSLTKKERLSKGCGKQWNRTI